jgi:hypothetical protein
MTDLRARKWTRGIGFAHRSDRALERLHPPTVAERRFRYSTSPADLRHAAEAC